MPDSDLVCPKCFRPLASATLVVEPENDRYGRRTRRYFSWCTECSQGFEVIQFAGGTRWHIHKYRRYYWCSVGDFYCVLGWQEVADLPEPAPVVIGPGGDFDEQYSLQKEHTQDMFKALTKAVGRVRKLVGVLISETTEGKIDVRK